MRISFGSLALTATILAAAPATADSDGQSAVNALASGLVIPQFDSAEGRTLFASKGCVVCHSINGVGGVDAPSLDAEFMDLPMNPFEFAARMWFGAEMMVELQREELGDVIYLDGEELANIIAFVHDADEQARFSEADIPEEIEALMVHAEEGADDDHAEEEADDDHAEEEADDDHAEEEADDDHD